jgi:hypothetical protein
MSQTRADHLLGSNAGRANITVIGRDGMNMEDLAASGDLETLHGTAIRGFPNFMTPGPLQSGAGASYVWNLDNLATHVAYIVSTAVNNADNGRRPVIEPTQEATGKLSRG